MENLSDEVVRYHRKQAEAMLSLVVQRQNAFWDAIRDLEQHLSTEFEDVADYDHVDLDDYYRGTP